MKKITLLLLIIATFWGCKKNKLKSNEAITLTGTWWYGQGSNAGTTLTYYNQLYFTSSSDADYFNSYIIGEKTNTYIGKVTYAIDEPKADNPNIKITGKNGFGTVVNENYIYNRSTGKLSLNGETYTKFK